MANAWTLFLQPVTTPTATLVGGTVDFYLPGTTGESNRKDVYLDPTEATVAANPYTLDAYATALLYGDGSYHVVIKASDGTTQYDFDNVTPSDAVSIFSQTAVASVYDLTQTASPTADQAVVISGFLESTGDGGGPFYWDDTKDKADANGITTIDPDTLGGFDGTTTTLAAFFAAQGTGTGSGCWVRIYEGPTLVSWCGAVDVPATDNAIALQAALDFLAGAYDTTLDGFSTVLDFGGKIYRTETSLDFTMVRTPGATIQNGGVHGACAGKIVIDFAGSNTVTLKDFLIYGDETDAPSVGSLFSRCDISGAFPSSAGHKMLNVFTNGYFSKAGHINFASEVSQYSACRFRNLDRSINSYAFVNVGNATTLDNYNGGLSSEYVTLPVASDGDHSNILHYLQQVHIQCAADFTIAITSVTKANPAVVEVDPTELASSEIQNGDVVFFGDIAGMLDLKYTWQTVANIDLTAGTFELSGIDSAAYDVFTSGNIRNQTSPAMLLNGTNSMYFDAGYFLTYGNVPIRVDVENGLPLRDCRMSFQAEMHPYSIIEFRRTSVAEAEVEGLELNLLSAYQYNNKDVLRITGGGHIKISNLKLNISNMGAEPDNGLFYPEADFRLHNARVYTPLEASLNTNANFLGYTGITAAADDNILSVVVDNVEFQETAVALTVPGLRFINDSLYSYRAELPGERRVHVQDTGITVDFTDQTSRINTFDKYVGKPAYNVTTARPVWASGGDATDVWVYADGTTAHTPV